MAWAKLGSTTLGSAGDAIDVTVESKKFITILTSKFTTGGDAILRLRLNADTGSNYARRNSWDGAADSTAVSQPQMTTDHSSILTTPSFTISYLINISTEEKLVMGYTVAQNTAGAGTAPGRAENTGKWANTSNAVTQINGYNSEAGSFDIDSNMMVIGTD